MASASAPYSKAYRVLEHRQLITARPKFGYFVYQQLGLPEMCRPAQRPVEISQWDLVLQLTRSLHYDELSGSAPLREQIARLMIDRGSHVALEGIIIITGCHEALSIAIHALCQPGNIVSVDSPSFHGVIQILKSFGMKALEIPTDPLTGCHYRFKTDPLCQFKRYQLRKHLKEKCP